MTNKPAFTRREFISNGAMIVSTMATVPLFLERSAWALTPATGSAVKDRPGVPGERILVVVQMTGGNDGINTVVPFGWREYYKARPGIGIAEKDVLKLDSNAGLGLNPEMGDLKAMMDAGQALGVLGVGYPNPNRSHFSSMDIWHTADPTGRSGKGFGWIGRTLDEMRSQSKGKIDATACVCVGNESPLAANGRQVKPVTFQDANLFRWAGGDLHASLAKEYETINRAGVVGNIDPNSPMAFVMRTALDAQIASQKIRSAVSREPVTRFGEGKLASQLRMVAAMIRAELPTRVYYVSLGGFDTHAGQPNTHGRNLREFSSAIRSFYAELKAIGAQSRVLTLAFSEFGRRVEQNASNGTDHGTAGPLFLFGEMVRATKTGLLGEQPSLAADRLDQGDLIYNTDFRSIYAAVLQDWMKADVKAVLGAPFRPASVIKT